MIRIFIICLTAGLILLGVSCQKSKPPTVIYEIPSGFRGVFFVIPCGQSVDPKIGVSNHRVVIDESGVGCLKDFKVFDDWFHAKVVSRNHDENCFLQSLGRSENKLIYFYGTKADHNIRIVGKSPLDLQPGRFK